MKEWPSPGALGMCQTLLGKLINSRNLKRAIGIGSSAGSDLTSFKFGSHHFNFCCAGGLSRTADHIRAKLLKYGASYDISYLSI